MDYFKLNRSVYATKSGDELVILDLKKDQYIFLDAEETIALNNYLKNDAPPTTIIQNLIDLNVVDKNHLSQEVLQPTGEKKAITPEIFTAIHQYIAKNREVKSLSLANCFLTAIFILLISIVLKCGGLSLCIKYLHHLKKYPLQMNHDKIQQVVATVNRVAQWFPFKVKCLTWSLTCAYLALWNRFSIDLVIGVARNPFFAHAWVEMNNASIIDEIEYRSYFYTIFSTSQ